MSLNRRGKVWWVDFYTPSGQRVRASARTQDKVAAQEYHDRLKAACWRLHKLGDKPRRTFDEAVVRWLKETSHKATHEEDKRHLRWLYKYFRGCYLDQITRDQVDRITEIRKGQGVANATVNRTLAVLRAVLRRAMRDWEWIERAPTIRMLPEPKRRVRFISREEAERLLAELPEHLAAMARFSLATGLRKSNVTNLQWSQVDLKRRCAWIHADQAKAGKAIKVPLNSEAMVVLRGQQGKHPVYVFSHRGRAPIRQLNTKAWRNALERAGIEHFRWHDLRHTFASWHVQAGTPLNRLQELGAWESIEMVKRYAHLDASHLAEDAERIARPRVVTNRSQFKERK